MQSRGHRSYPAEHHAEWTSTHVGASPTMIVSFAAVAAPRRATQAAYGRVDQGSRGLEEGRTACAGPPPVSAHGQWGDPLRHRDGPHGACMSLPKSLLDRCVRCVGAVLTDYSSQRCVAYPLPHCDPGLNTDLLTQVQQLLHSISLTAADRPAWRDTTWFQNKFGRDAGLCPNAVQ